MIIERLSKPLSSLIIVVISAASLEAQPNKRPRITLAIYESTRQLSSVQDARDYTEPFARYVADKLKIDMELEFPSGNTGQQLLDFGRRLNSGEYDIGCVWGLEFGWLSKEYPALQPLVIVDRGDPKMGYPSQLIVDINSKLTSLSDLRRMRLLMTGTTLADCLWLEAEVHRIDGRESTRTFFSSVDRCNVNDAVDALFPKDNRAVPTTDCLMLSAPTWNAVKEEFPWFAARTTTIRNSDRWPNALFIGNPAVLDRKRPALWKQLREEFVASRNTRRGEVLNDHWDINGFITGDTADKRAQAHKKLISELLPTYTRESLDALQLPWRR